jgi:hypothetical protein
MVDLHSGASPSSKRSPRQFVPWVIAALAITFAISVGGKVALLKADTLRLERTLSASEKRAKADIDRLAGKLKEAQDSAVKLQLQVDEAVQVINRLRGVTRAPSTQGKSESDGRDSQSIRAASTIDEPTRTDYEVVEFARSANHIVVYVYFSTFASGVEAEQVARYELSRFVNSNQPREDVQFFCWLKRPNFQSIRLSMADGSPSITYSSRTGKVLTSYERE